jgi:hypothetical protein
MIISEQDFFNQEVERLRDLLNRKCQQYWEEIEITATVDGWAENQTDDVLQFHIEDGTPVSKLIGMKVRAVGSRQSACEVLVSYGIVGYDYVAYADIVRPFDDLDYAKRPTGSDYPDAVKYDEAVRQHIKDEADREAMRQERLEQNLLFVVWYDKDGNKMCQGWHNDETLSEVE